MVTQLKASGPLSFFLIGVASAVVGLVPWLITGAHLPLQNLWATDTPPAQMPVALLPFSQYLLTLIVAVILTGSAIAGTLARIARSQQPRFATVAIVLGVVMMQVVAVVQTTITVLNGLQPTATARLYVTALALGTAGSILVGVLVLLLIARAPAAGAVVAASVAAVSFGPWLGAIVRAAAFESDMAFFAAVRWVPAIIVGLAIAWWGLATIGRLAAAIASLLTLWMGTALFTAVTAAAGSLVLAPHLAEMLDYGAQVFVAALSIPGGSLFLLVPAVIVAVLGLTVRWAMRRTARSAVDPADRT